jgi:hypothetical protein
MFEQTVEVDVAVIGGGLAGVCAAVAAARLGRRVALVNNRPVLGGNSSSEVRVWVVGATAHGNQHWAREAGIVGEMYVENQYRNPEGNPVYWDDVVLDTVRREPNLQLFLNTDVREVEADGPDDARVIRSVTGWTMGAEILTRFVAPVFLDCTGDGLVGSLAGARYRLGKEARSEFDEAWAPEEATREFLGSTLLFYTKDAGRPVKFVAPETAIDVTKTPIPTSRIIRSGDQGAHYWWIEWGGQLDIVHDNERIRDELRGVVLGVWDYIKNSGKFEADNLTLEWIGNVPGKREYRRFVGDYTLTQNDVIEQHSFPDTVAYGGWSIDLHPAEGMYHPGSGAVQRFSDGVFEIPYRCLYSVNVTNMLMAGRDFSATHVAFGAARVMATCATMGEAAGTAAALCAERGVTPRALGQDHLTELKQTLLRQDAPILGTANEDPTDLARTGRVSASSAFDVVGVPDSAAADARPEPLVDDLAVALPVNPELGGVELLVAAQVDTALDVELWSVARPQNLVPHRLEAGTRVQVRAGERHWVKAELAYRPAKPETAVLVVRANPDATWHSAAPLPPGVLSMVHREDIDDPNVEIGTGQELLAWPTKPLRGRALCFQAFPRSAALTPHQAVSGYSRPYGGPNMWSSAPMTPGQPEWLRVDWDAPVVAREVRLVFDDDPDLELNTLHHHRSPDEVIPQLVRDYRVEVLAEDGQWQLVADVTDNRWRRRIHPLPAPAPVRAVRLVVSATNGVPEVRVVQLRVQA